MLPNVPWEVNSSHNFGRLQFSEGQTACSCVHTPMSISEPGGLLVTQPGCLSSLSLSGTEFGAKLLTGCLPQLVHWSRGGKPSQGKPWRALWRQLRWFTEYTVRLGATWWDPSTFTNICFGIFLGSAGLHSVSCSLLSPTLFISICVTVNT